MKHPGIYVDAFIIKALKLTQAELAEHIGVSRLTVSEIILGKRNLTASIALRLAKLTHTSAKSWLQLQTEYDLIKYAQKEKLILKRIKPL